MRGMDMGPGTDLGGLGWFLGIWVTMMAAMMLPSALPVVLLFALGVMSLLWMAIVAALVFAEKVVPAGDKLSPLVAVALVAVGVWIAIDPGSFPGLVQPM